MCGLLLPSATVPECYMPAENFSFMAITAMQVPLGEGYSQMDWIRHKKSAPDLAGKPTRLGFQLLSFPCACWPVLDRAPTFCRAKRAAQATQHHIGGGEAAQHRGRCMGSLEWQGDLCVHVWDAPGGAQCSSKNGNLLLDTAAPLAPGLRAKRPFCHVPVRGSWLD